MRIREECAGRSGGGVWERGDRLAAAGRRRRRHGKFRGKEGIGCAC